MPTRELLAPSQRAQFSDFTTPLDDRTLAALRQPPRRPTPATFVALAERLQTIRAIGLNPDVARQVHQTRLVRLAREGARYSPQFLQRFGPARPARFDPLALLTTAFPRV